MNEENIKNEDVYVNDNIEYVASLEEKIREQHDDYLYLAADFDNYRKRMNTKLHETVRTANADLIRQMLEILDDFERSFGYEDTGNRHIYDKFVNLLRSHGLQKLDIKYLDVFDTDTCEAIGTVPTTEEDKIGRIQEVVLPAYRLNDTMLRHARVIVYKYETEQDEQDITDD